MSVDSKLIKLAQVIFWLKRSTSRSFEGQTKGQRSEVRVQSERALFLDSNKHSVKYVNSKLVKID